MSVHISDLTSKIYVMDCVLKSCEVRVDLTKNRLIEAIRNYEEAIEARDRNQEVLSHLLKGAQASNETSSYLYE